MICGMAPLPVPVADVAAALAELAALPTAEVADLTADPAEVVAELAAPEALVRALEADSEASDAPELAWLESELA